ncbi:pyruvate ferredoxin oxidoreductase [Candidatus Falkowbacteria bacterium]|nr:pyruvate ferredoxin oxidoreductase [Candidatus Falkowbacteria bacterium]
MKQIRLHGRGGQGVVTAAELVAIAAFKNGYEAQAFPSFGVERTGAPVQAFARVDKKFIRTREQVSNPDILIILDSTLIGTVDLFSDCDKKTQVIVNTTKKAKELGVTFGPDEKKLPLRNITAVDATKIALDIFGKNLANTTILGALAKAVPFITLESLKEAIAEKFQEKGEAIVEKNIQAVETAHNS